MDAQLTEKIERLKAAKFEPVDSNLFDWTAPKPLPAPLPTAPSITFEMTEQMIPEPFRAWILDCAERLQVPIESVAVGVFCTLSSVCGRKLGIFPKREDDWLVIPNLWASVVARPGQKKTATLDQAMVPLESLETEARVEFEAKCQHSKANVTVTKLKIEAVENDLRKKIKSGDNIGLDKAKGDLCALQKQLCAETVTERRYRTSDATVEKIGELLVENPNGLLLKRDELSGWLSGLNRHGHEGDREFFLEAWNGNGKFDVDRIKRGTLHIESLCLSVLGSIQPGKLLSYVREACGGGAGDDGLLSRFQLLVFPEKSTEDPIWIDRKPDFSARDRAIQVFKAVGGLNSESTVGPIGIRFEERAQTIADDWFLELERRLHRAEDLSPAFEAHLSKYRSLMPSLALLFQLIESHGVQPSGVGESAVIMAAFWCDFLEAHAKKIYAITSNSEVFGAEALAAKIKEGRVVDGMKVRDIHRHHWAMLGTHSSRKIEPFCHFWH